MQHVSTHHTPRRQPAILVANMRIVQMSDLHVGEGLLRPELLSAAV
jgi:hypothetical protein